MVGKISSPRRSQAWDCSISRPGLNLLSYWGSLCQWERLQGGNSYREFVSHSTGLSLKGNNLLPQGANSFFKEKPPFSKSFTIQGSKQEKYIICLLISFTKWSENLEVFPFTLNDQDSVVQSIVSLTSLLRGQLKKCFTTL